jgi:hypothetical protein
MLRQPFPAAFAAVPLSRSGLVPAPILPATSSAHAAVAERRHDEPAQSFASARGDVDAMLCRPP